MGNVNYEEGGKKFAEDFTVRLEERAKKNIESASPKDVQFYTEDFKKRKEFVEKTSKNVAQVLNERGIKLFRYAAADYEFLNKKIYEAIKEKDPTVKFEKGVYADFALGVIRNQANLEAQKLPTDKANEVLEAGYCGNGGGEQCTNTMVALERVNRSYDKVAVYGDAIMQIDSSSQVDNDFKNTKCYLPNEKGEYSEVSREVMMRYVQQKMQAGVDVSGKWSTMARYNDEKGHVSVQTSKGEVHLNERFGKSYSAEALETLKNGGKHFDEMNQVYDRALMNGDALTLWNSKTFYGSQDNMLASTFQVCYLPNEKGEYVQVSRDEWKIYIAEQKSAGKDMSSKDVKSEYHTDKPGHVSVQTPNGELHLNVNTGKQYNATELANLGVKKAAPFSIYQAQQTGASK
jgi:hypothetical protein